MKKQCILPFAAFFMLGMFMGACSEDKGNYDYTPINEVTIEEIDVARVYEAGSHITATPTISVLDETTSNLSYSWTINGQEVSTQEVLDIDLPPLDYADHLCALTITDNDTGMQYRQTFTIQIMNPFNYGYYFLTQMDDGSSEMVYIPSTVDEPTVADVKYTTGVADIPFGSNPKQIYGTFGYNQATATYYWTMMFMTEDSEYPVIVTDNSSFEPVYLLSDNSFLVPEEGYTFHPTEIVANMGGTIYFISDGQFIYYNESKLYRPAKHVGEYYWSHPVIGFSNDIFAWVYDELSHKYYTIQAYNGNDFIPEGMTIDGSAWDKVMEPKDNPTIAGNVLTAIDVYAGQHTCNVISAEANLLHTYTFNRAWVNGANPAPEPVFVGEQQFALNGLTENASVAVGGRTGLSAYQFYVNAGNDIYYSSTLGQPSMNLLTTIPSDLGEVEYIGLSAKGNRLVVVLYDENSAEERKGSVVYVDLNTRAITHTFPHILHHCKSYWGANDSNSAYMTYGDGM